MLPATPLHGSAAWIGDNGSGPAAALYRGALREYRRLEAELPGAPIRWTGSLSWTDDPSTPGAPGSGPHQGFTLGSAEVAALEPNLRRPPAQVTHAPGDGAVDPLALTETLLRAARQQGTEILLAAATGLRHDAGRFAGVETSAGFLPADTVVLAAGVDMPVLCSPLGVDLPVEASPALLVRFTAPHDLVRTVVSSPEIEVRQNLDGGLLAAVPYDGRSTPEELADTGRRALTLITSMFRRAEAIALNSVSVGIRPVPVDGVPIVGRLPGAPDVFVAVMHSGVQLAAIAGRLVAEEIVERVDATELSGCRPTRFFRQAADLS